MALAIPVKKSSSHQQRAREVRSGTLMGRFGEITLIGNPSPEPSRKEERV
jgi:hypothetical protein